MPSVATISESVITIPSYYVTYLDVLKPQELEMLFGFCADNKDAFKPSEVTGKPSETYRKSLVMFDPPVFREFFVSQVYRRLPEIFNLLGVAPFQPSEIETQLTASQDGDLFKVHTDSGTGDTATRQITYVYYFGSHRFTGGELKFWDTKVTDGISDKGDTSEVVAPVANSMVVFKSDTWHEVMPVINPDSGFVDSRFTVNGWIRR
jgi:Rps23 Pro-64 3,4-dihydroxylase Tpa1-like proline 4-hydroxylase